MPGTVLNTDIKQIKWLLSELQYETQFYIQLQESYSIRENTRINTYSNNIKLSVCKNKTKNWQLWAKLPDFWSSSAFGYANLNNFNLFKNRNFKKYLSYSITLSLLLSYRKPSDEFLAIKEQIC